MVLTGRSIYARGAYKTAQLSCCESSLSRGLKLVEEEQGRADRSWADKSLLKRRGDKDKTVVGGCETTSCIDWIGNGLGLDGLLLAIELNQQIDCAQLVCLSKKMDSHLLKLDVMGEEEIEKKETEEEEVKR